MRPNKNVVAALEKVLPSSDSTRKSLITYLSRANMSYSQFGELAGYRTTAIASFARNAYTIHSAASDVFVRRAIEEAMERHPVGEPETEADGTLYETENVNDLRRWFLHCQQKRALACCYGPPGSQKTFVLKHLVAEFNRKELPRKDACNRAHYIRASVRMQPRDFMVKLCQAAGALTGPSLQRCLVNLRIQLNGTQTLFVVDEAQHLSIDCLEALRELYDEAPRIGAMLAGSHNLKLLFDRRASELEQWNSRLDAAIELKGISDECGRAVISRELPGLKAIGVEKLLAGARVADVYSKQHSEYLNVRRLFKAIDAVREAAGERKPAAGKKAA